MNERERWIVYPLLFFALGTALREKIDFFEGVGIPQEQVIAKRIVLVNDNFETMAVLGSNKKGTNGEMQLFHKLPDQSLQLRYSIEIDSQGQVLIKSPGEMLFQPQGQLMFQSQGQIVFQSQGQVIFIPPLQLQIPGFMLFPTMQLQQLLQRQQQPPATPPRAAPREPKAAPSKPEQSKIKPTGS